VCLLVCLSIIIPSYRRDDLLRLCLRSVIAFAPPRTQLLVVDDGSPNAVISRTAQAFPGVTTIRHETSGGFCAAVNSGLAHAHGDIIELLNDDAEVTAGWADAARRWFDDATIGAVAPLVLQSPANATPLIDTAGDEYDVGGFARKRGHGQVFTITGPFARSCEVWGVSAAAGFYRADVLRAIGGFPTSFGAYFEDVDVSFRLRDRGYRVQYDPQSIVWHRVSSSYGRRPSRRVIRQQSRNEELVFWRNVSRKHLPRHIAVLGGKAVRRVREGTLWPWTLGRFDAWRAYSLGLD
jgi:GT2 family glycosyltransferase